MRAAALQFDVLDDPQANLDAVELGLADAARGGIELVVLPEMWPTSFPPAQADAESLLRVTEAANERARGLSAELDLCVVGSGFARARGGLVNRLRCFDRGAEILSYDKVHLFTPTAEGECFQAGEDPPATVDASIGKLSGAICYDLRFPEILRVPFREGVELLAICAQWPDTRAAHWRALVIARAIENQCCVVACNRTGSAEIGRRRLRLDFPGNSLVVTPHGEVLAEGRGEAGLITADLDLDLGRRLRTRVPVLKDDRSDLYRGW